MAQPLTPPVGPGVPQTTQLQDPVPFANDPTLQGLAAMPSSYEQMLEMLDPNRPGTFSGGPSTLQAYNILNPSGYTVSGPRTPLDQPIISGLKSPSQDHFGNLNFDFLDPMGAYEGILRATGIIGDKQTTMPGGFDPALFLQQKDIDLFGQGATGAPARFADYAISLPMTLMEAALNGGKAPGSTTNPADANKQLTWSFEHDGAYWQYLTVVSASHPGDDQPLHDFAHALAAGAISDPAQQQALEAQLYDSVSKDRDIAVGITSGNDRIDYLAKQYVQNYIGSGRPLTDMFTPDGHVSTVIQGGFGPSISANPFHDVPGDIANLVPFIGTQAAQFLSPINAQTEQAWNNMTPQQRRAIFGQVGLSAMASDVGVTLITFGGVGVVRGLALAGELGDVAVRAAQVYDVVTKAATLTMAAGVTAAAANWALEAYSPWYDENIGKVVDASRPVSGSSMLAGVANQLGYLSSGTFGLYTASKIGREAIGGIFDLGSRIPYLGRVIPAIGDADAPFFRDTYGGSPAVAFVERLTNGSLSATDMRQTIQRTMLSGTHNFIADRDLAQLQSLWRASDEEGAIASANPRIAEWAALKQSGPAGRELAAQEFQQALGVSAESVPMKAEQIMQILSAHDPRISPWALDSTVQAIEQQKLMSRTLHDAITQDYASRFGTRWQGLLTADDLRAKAADLLQQGGHEINDDLLNHLGRLGASGMDQGRQVLNLIYDSVFARKYAELSTLAKDTKEAGTLSVGSLRNLYKDEIPLISKLLRGGEFKDEDLADLWRSDMPIDPDKLYSWVMDRNDVARYVEREHVQLPADSTSPGSVMNGVHQGAKAKRTLADLLDEVVDMFPSRRTLQEIDNGGALNDFQRQLEQEGNWTVIGKPRRDPFSEPTEAGPLERTITGQDRAQSDFASIRRLRDGTIFKSPWIEYPLGSVDQIELGNRGVLASMFDRVTTGTRAWRIGEFQRANLHRLLNSKYSGLTENQINRLHQAITDLASGRGTKTLGIGGLKIETPSFAQFNRSMQGWAWEPEAAATAATVFKGAPLIDRATGEAVLPDWNRLLAQAYQQSFRQNITAGLTSRIKAMPHGFGKAAVFLGEDLYLRWRFSLSPLFKLSEVAESPLYNAAHGVYFQDPMVANMYLRSLGEDSADAMRTEYAAGDSFLQGIGHGYIEASPRAKAAAGGYLIPRGEATADAVRQTSFPRMVGSIQPDQVQESIFSSHVGEQLPNRYSAAVPDSMLPAGRVAGQEIHTLLENEANKLWDGMTPAQIEQVGRMNSYLMDLANEWRPMASQPLRMRASGATPIAERPVVLKPEAYDKIVPTWGEATHGVAKTMPVLPGDQIAELQKAYDEWSYRSPVPADLSQYRDEYFAYRLGQRPAPPIPPQRWSQAPNWARQQAAMDSSFDKLARGITDDAKLPPAGQATRDLPGELSGTPLTPAAIARLRQIELAKAVSTAGPDETMADILGRYINGKSDIHLTPTTSDFPWEQVEAIFVHPGEQKQWFRFLSTLPEGHALNAADMRFYDGTDQGLATALGLYSMERAGMTDMASRTMGSLGTLTRPSESLASNLDRVVNNPDFALGLRQRAANKLGYDPGEPMIRAYLRFDPQTQGDDLVVSVRAADGLPLGLTQQEIEQTWLDYGAPRGFGASLGEDANAYLQSQRTMNAVAWTPEGMNGSDNVAGSIHVYEDPFSKPSKTARIEKGVNPMTTLEDHMFSDPGKRPIPIVFADRFDPAKRSYQPVTDLYPRFEQGHAIVADNAVHYSPRSGSGWTYKFDVQPNYVDVTLDPLAEGHQAEEQLRDAFQRFRGETIRVNLPTKEAEDAYARLWLRGEVTSDIVGMTKTGPFDLAALRTRLGVPEDTARSAVSTVGDMRQLPFTADAMAEKAEFDIAASKIQPRAEADWVTRWKEHAKEFGRTVANPTPFKVGQQQRMAAYLMDNKFADLLELNNKPMYDFYRQELGVPRAAITRFQIENRMAYDDWVRSGSMDDFDRLVAHSSQYNKDPLKSVEAVRKLYESPDWVVLHDLWLLNARSQMQDAFTTHFFSSYRNVIERSLNHPVLGIFPLSWAYKAAREWATFLFNNRTLGLHLGMTPAVALKQIQRAQDEWWAQQAGQNETFGQQFNTKRGSDFGSLMYMFNLLLPGDWSGIPFPLAWPIRDQLRVVTGQARTVGQDPFAPDSYFQNWGLSRDKRLATEAFQELQKWLGPPPEKKPGITPTALTNEAMYRAQQPAPQQAHQPAQPQSFPIVGQMPVPGDLGENPSR